MLGLDSYGSDSDSGGEETQVKQTTVTKPADLTKPKPKKKITIGLSSLPKPSNEDETSDQDAPPTTKKRKLENGAGASGLLSMLPAPKKKGLALPPPSKPSQPKPLDNPYTAAPPTSFDLDVAGTEEGAEPVKATPAFVPTSVRKGKANVSVEETKSKPPSSAPAVDFFGLASASSTKPSSLAPSSTVTPSPASISVSSAPTIAHFEPPEPTPTDPYPGYYQLPSGTWAAYDAEYYGKFMKKWQIEYDAHVRALEKGTAKGFEEMDSEAMHEVNAQEEMERAKIEIKDREEKKALTQGAGAGPAQPNMKITASKMSGIARSRHQLSTLLREAYENREALEERIAQGKRNRKEAGNKYGF